MHLLSDWTADSFQRRSVQSGKSKVARRAPIPSFIHSDGCIAPYRCRVLPSGGQGGGGASGDQSRLDRPQSTITFQNRCGSVSRVASLLDRALLLMRRYTTDIHTNPIESFVSVVHCFESCSRSRKVANPAVKVCLKFKWKLGRIDLGDVEINNIWQYVRDG